MSVGEFSVVPINPMKLIIEVTGFDPSSASIQQLNNHFMTYFQLINCTKCPTKLLVSPAALDCIKQTKNLCKIEYAGKALCFACLTFWEQTDHIRSHI